MPFEFRGNGDTGMALDEEDGQEPLRQALLEAHQRLVRAQTLFSVSVRLTFLSSLVIFYVGVQSLYATAFEGKSSPLSINVRVLQLSVVFLRLLASNLPRLIRCCYCCYQCCSFSSCNTLFGSKCCVDACQRCGVRLDPTDSAEQSETATTGQELQASGQAGSGIRRRSGAHVISTLDAATGAAKGSGDRKGSRVHPLGRTPAHTPQGQP
ncbi:MAG: hypothetical protein VX683_01710, partial [Cyanobacteriota bacterium]|nr:hypothetical protein [Cyanobacteriota bacterium]